VTGNPRWTQRLQITSYVLHGAVFVIATAAEILTRGLTTTTAAGIVIALVGVGFGVSIKLPFPASPWRPATAISASVILYSIAIALTGGVASTFTLLPVATIFIAAAGGGIAYALPTVLGSIVAVFGAAWLTDTTDDVADLVRVFAFYAITALAFSEVQRAIMSETERAQRLIVASDAAHTRMDRLTATHELLADLAQVAQSPDINAVTTAQNSIRDVGLILPDTPTRIVASNDTILARRGTTPDHPAARQFAIMCSGEEVAHLEMWDEASHLDDSEISAITSAIEPVGLAIDNDVLLQKLAGITIQRERVRLARELHDDVAPSVAAVGLALDMALMSGDLDEQQTRNLTATRSNVSRLVDQIRQRVQDLRADRSISVVEMAHSLVAEVDADGPTVIVNIDERTPPRPAIAIELGGFVTEAFRNALRHANATAIWITGRITDHDGFLAVQDNGVGFDRDEASHGHFGLVGMKERASVIAADFELDTTPGEGTVVSMTWKDGPR
jgi:signal transduction histidine kinase